MNVMYSTDGNGLWIRREWAEQCPERVLLASRCQGIKGHKGLHWCYKPDGSFAWGDNVDDPREDGCSGTTPPGHGCWVSPLEKQGDCWSNNSTDTQITDPETIVRLEQDDPPEGDDASRAEKGSGLFFRTQPALPRQWLAWVNQPQTDVELKVLRACIRRSCPFADETWASNRAARLNLESTRRPRGRPRNESCPPVMEGLAGESQRPPRM